MSELPHFERPYDWAAIDHAVRTTGGAIARGFLGAGAADDLNAEIDAFFEVNTDAGRPGSTSELYDAFLGHDTLRLQGLIAKFAGAAAFGNIKNWSA